MEDGVKRRRKMEEKTVWRYVLDAKHEPRRARKKEMSARGQRYDDGMYTGEKTREQAWDQLRKRDHV